MERGSFQFNLHIKKKILSSNFKPQLSPILQMVQKCVWGGSWPAVMTTQLNQKVEQFKCLTTPLKQELKQLNHGWLKLSSVKGTRTPRESGARAVIEPAICGVWRGYAPLSNYCYEVSACPDPAWLPSALLLGQ